MIAALFILLLWVIWLWISKTNLSEIHTLYPVWIYCSWCRRTSETWVWCGESSVLTDVIWREGWSSLASYSPHAEKPQEEPSSLPGALSSPCPACLDELLHGRLSQVMFTSQTAQQLGEGTVQSKAAHSSVGTSSKKPAFPPGFLLCCWPSWLVASTSGESLEPHLGFPMLEQGYAPTAPTFLLLGQFMFSFGCWVSWNHVVCPYSSDRVKQSCIIPENCSCRLFSTTPLLPYTFPVSYTDHSCCVADCEVRTVFQTPNVGFSYHNV